jgi:hypothetical protein
MLVAKRTFEGVDLNSAPHQNTSIYGERTHTTVVNSARMFEHKSASKVSIFSFLLPIILGIITSPGRWSPRLRLVVPSPSSKTKQLFASGYIESEGKISLTAALNSAVIDERESVCEQLAMPMTPRGKRDGRNRDMPKCDEDGG